VAKKISKKCNEIAFQGNKCIVTDSISKNEENRKYGHGQHPNSQENLRQGGPGRPRGSKNHNGMTYVLKQLVAVMAEEENVARMKDWMQEKIRTAPQWAWNHIYLPLSPKSLDINQSVNFDEEMSELAKKEARERLTKGESNGQE